MLAVSPGTFCHMNGHKMTTNTLQQEIMAQEVTTDAGHLWKFHSQACLSHISTQNMKS